MSPAFANFDQATYFALFTFESFFRDEIEGILWFGIKTHSQNASTVYAMLGHGGLYARSSLAMYRFLTTLLSKTRPETREHLADATIFTGLYMGHPFSVIFSKEGKFTYDI